MVVQVDDRVRIIMLAAGLILAAWPLSILLRWSMTLDELKLLMFVGMGSSLGWGGLLLYLGLRK